MKPFLSPWQRIKALRRSNIFMWVMLRIINSVECFTVGALGGWSEVDGGME